jgi:hypothetical protein
VSCDGRPRRVDVVEVSDEDQDTCPCRAADPRELVLRFGRHASEEVTFMRKQTSVKAGGRGKNG